MEHILEPPTPKTLNNDDDNDDRDVMLTLMMGARRSQESATRVKGRIQRVVNMISVKREQNTRLTWGQGISGNEPLKTCHLLVHVSVCL